MHDEGGFTLVLAQTWRWKLSVWINGVEDALFQSVQPASIAFGKRASVAVFEHKHIDDAPRWTGKDLRRDGVGAEAGNGLG